MGKHYKKQLINKKFFIINIVRLLFLFLLIISIIYIVKWLNDNKQNKILEEKISEAIIIETIDNLESEKNAETKYKVDFEKLEEINTDIIAWLKVNGTDIENTVVKGNDNNYYLNHNFEKQYNQAGWLFADYKNKFDGTDKNLIIYGHNRKNGSMFGTLKNILTEEWYDNEENYIITFITEKEEVQYKVFSVYEIKNEEYYIKTNFENSEFSEFIETLKNRSIKDFNVEITSEDSILTLSTCANSNKNRIVLHAKKLNNN